jgi:hypothetical protein
MTGSPADDVIPCRHTRSKLFLRNCVEDISVFPIIISCRAHASGVAAEQSVDDDVPAMWMSEFIEEDGGAV